MQLFQGTWRKLALLPLFSLVIGWLVFLVGFTLLMVDTDDKANFRNVAYFVTTAAPLPLVLLAFLHAMFSGVLSSILGSLAAILSVICFSSVGFVLYASALEVYNDIEEGRKQEVRFVLMSVGTLIMSLSWVLVLVFWNYFPYKVWTVDQYADYVVDEDGSMDSPPSMPQEPSLFTGIARKIAVIFLVLKGASWCLLLIGIDIKMHHPNANSSAYHVVSYPEDSLPFSTWTIGVVGILLIFSALLHAGAKKEASSMAGIFASLFSVLYLICAGYVVVGVAVMVYGDCEYRLEGVDDNCFVDSLPRCDVYLLCGGLGTGFFLACVLALWPFYHKPVGNAQEMRRNIERRRGYYQRNNRFSEERVPLLQPDQSPRRPSTPII